MWFSFVPWSSQAEWLQLKNLLFDDHDHNRDHDHDQNNYPYNDNVAARQRGVQRVLAWKARSKVPLAVEATALLTSCLMSYEAAGEDMSAEQAMQLNLTLGTAIVRFVSGFTDEEQKGTVAQSVYQLASTLGIPIQMVDIRHETVHGLLPSLQVMVTAAREAMKWLYEKYWMRQANVNMPREKDVSELLANYAKAANTYSNMIQNPQVQQSWDMRNNLEMIAEKALDYLQQIETIIPPNAVHEALVKTLIRSKIIIPNRNNRPRMPDLRLSPKWVSCWGPAIDSFQRRWGGFHMDFLVTIIKCLKQVPRFTEKQEKQLSTRAEAYSTPSLVENYNAMEILSLVAWARYLIDPNMTKTRVGNKGRPSSSSSPAMNIAARRSSSPFSSFSSSSSSRASGSHVSTAEDEYIRLSADDDETGDPLSRSTLFEKREADVQKESPARSNSYPDGDPSQERVEGNDGQKELSEEEKRGARRGSASENPDGSSGQFPGGRDSLFDTSYEFVEVVPQGSSISHEPDGEENYLGMGNLAHILSLLTTDSNKYTFLVLESIPALLANEKSKYVLQDFAKLQQKRLTLSEPRQIPEDLENVSFVDMSDAIQEAEVMLQEIQANFASNGKAKGNSNSRGDRAAMLGPPAKHGWALCSPAEWYPCPLGSLPGEHYPSLDLPPVSATDLLHPVDFPAYAGSALTEKPKRIWEAMDSTERDNLAKKIKLF